MVHYLLPNGGFIICHEAADGSTTAACRWINREENEISRHYAKHHPGGGAIPYKQCKVVTEDAARAFVGQQKLDKAKEKGRGGGAAFQVANVSDVKADIDGNWQPTPDQINQLPVTARPARPAATAAAAADVVDIRTGYDHEDRLHELVRDVYTLATSIDPVPNPEQHPSRFGTVAARPADDVVEDLGRDEDSGDNEDELPTFDIHGRRT